MQVQTKIPKGAANSNLGKRKRPVINEEDSSDELYNRDNYKRKQTPGYSAVTSTGGNQYGYAAREP